MGTRLIIAILLIIAVPSITVAAPAKPGPYASAFLGVTVTKDADVTTDQYFTSVETFNDRLEFDPGVFVGGTGGYDFGVVRVEGEFSYKYNELEQVTNRDTGYRYRNVDGEVGSFAFMANVFLDLHNETPVTPYLGGGVGFATIYVSDTYAYDNQGRIYIYDEDEDSVFAYQIGGGLDIALNRRISLDLGYRYFATEKASFNNSWYSDQLKTLKLQSHNVAVGVRFKF